MGLPDKYKGKSFAKAAKNIQDTYQDRFDPISMRGMRKTFESLKAAQEQVKAQQAPQQGQEQQQGQMGAPQVQPVQGGQPNVDLSQAESNTPFDREASKAYNEKFAYGGNMSNDYFNGGELNNVSSTPFTPFDTSDGSDIFNTQIQSGDQIQLDRYRSQAAAKGNDKDKLTSQDKNKIMGGIGLALQGAPLIGNIAQLATLKKPDKETARTVNTSAMTAALDNFNPRQQNFDKIDMNQVERGITEASGRFTQNNVNASRGNAGSFVANELANQNNLYRAIGDARMKGQQSDLQVDQMNAQEVARVDAMNAQKAMTKAGISSKADMFNAQMQYRNDVNNAQNEAAYDTRKAELWGGIAGSVANIGASLGNMAKANKATGYDQFGNLSSSTNSNANGGTMENGLPTTPPFSMEEEDYGTGTMLDAMGEVKFPDASKLFAAKKKYEGLKKDRDKFVSIGNKESQPTVDRMDTTLKYAKKDMDILERERDLFFKNRNGLLDNKFANGGTMGPGDKDKVKEVSKPFSKNGMIDIEPNPMYVYDELDEDGIGKVTRLKPMYRFTEDAEISPDDQLKNFQKDGQKDKYEKYRSQFVKQMQKGSIDKSKYIVNDENEVILKDGYIMLGSLEDALYRKVNKDGKDIIEYKLPSNTKKKK